MKKLLTYGVAFLITVAVCMAMLLFATYAPQSWIDLNVIESVPGLLAEGHTPQFGDRGYIGQLDNWSESLILMSSKAMVEDSKSTVLTNPLYGNWTESPVQALSEYAWAVKPEPVFYYTRYWMGFRAVVRWLLAFLDYFQIRRYLAMGFFVLLYCVIQKVSKYLGKWQAAVFALSILLVRPYIICNSLQLSCCFLVAFFAMLAVPWVYRHPQYRGLFFMEVGMFTMYFDFYTTPLITFAMPMIYLSLLQEKETGRTSLWDMLKSLLIWLTAYVGMWLAKLVLTDLLTDQPGITAAFARLFEWLGVGGHGTNYDSINSPLLALQSVYWNLLPDGESRVLFWLVMAALVGWIIWKAKKKELDIHAAKKSSGMLFLAATPVIWFIASAAPLVLHCYFQYRSVVVLFWAVGAYLCLITEKTCQENEK